MGTDSKEWRDGNSRKGMIDSLIDVNKQASVETLEKSCSNQATLER